MKSFFLIFVLVFFSCQQKTEVPFRFEKLVFDVNGSGCEGYCHSYHLEIDSGKNAKLYARVVYKNWEDINRIFNEAHQNNLDTVYQDSLKILSKMGFFVGHVNDTSFRKLVYQLEKINLDSLKVKDEIYFDVVRKNLIVYYNGKKNVIKTQIPSDSLKTIFYLLYEIFGQNNYSRVDSFPLGQ